MKHPCRNEISPYLYYCCLNSFLDMGSTHRQYLTSFAVTYISMCLFGIRRQNVDLWRAELFLYNIVYFSLHEANIEKELGFCKTTTSVGSLNTLFLFFYSTLHHNQAKKPATINTNNLATIHDYVSILVAISSALWHNSLIPGKLLLPWALAIV